MSVLQKLFGGSQSEKSPQERFWDWFAKNEAALLQVRTGEEPICRKLHYEMQRVHESLAFEFGNADARPREFVVSADGVKDAFPAVEGLVAAAPRMPKWKVTAFRQPRPGPVTLNIGNRRLESHQVFFRARPESDRIALTIALPDYRPTSAHIHEHAGYLMLDHFAGEYAVETQLGAIDFVDDKEIAGAGWRPIADLPEVLGLAVPSPV